MIYALKKDTGRKKKDKRIYDEIGEINIDNAITIGSKIQHDKKTYAVKAIENENDGYKNLEVIEVDKNYQEPTKQVYRRDRFGNRVIVNKDGTEQTIGKDGKIIRKWGKDGELIQGKPYPELRKAAI
jgi:hypothetical protein